MKAVQYFTDEYLARCRAMSPDQILRYLDDFRRLLAAALMKAWLLGQAVAQQGQQDAGADTL